MHVGETVPDVSGAKLARYLRGELRVKRRGEPPRELTHSDGPAGGDVDCMTGRSGHIHRCQGGPHHVRDMHEVADLATVLKHSRRTTVEDPRSEDRGHPRVRVGERLPRPVHVEVRLEPVGAAEHQGQLLLVALRDAGSHEPT